MSEASGQAIVTTPLGRLALACSGRQLTGASFIDPPEAAGTAQVSLCSLQSEDAASAEALRQAHARLVRYFDGEIVALEGADILYRGTAFQQRIWQALSAIPAGQTRSYSEVAREAGSPRGVRAAGLACGANPIVLFVPCHRVIGKNGSLTGFGGGLSRKSYLLRHEQPGAPALSLVACASALPR